MLRVPSALVDAVKELSRLHRSGYTSAILTGLQQLIATVDSTADSVDSITAGKSDTELLAELISSIDERIATQVAVHVAQLEQRVSTQIEAHIRKRQENLMQGFSSAYELGQQIERSKWQSPLSAESAIGEEISAPATPSSELVEEAAPTQGKLVPLTSTELAERLDCHNSSVSRAKKKENQVFRQWTAEHDPDHIAWEYRNGEGKKKFHPLV